MDKLKLSLTITAATQALDKLEKALYENDQRKVGAALYEIRRELYLLKGMVKDPRKGGEQ